MSPCPRLPTMNLAPFKNLFQTNIKQIPSLIVTDHRALSALPVYSFSSHCNLGCSVVSSAAAERGWLHKGNWHESHVCLSLWPRPCSLQVLVIPSPPPQWRAERGADKLLRLLVHICCLAKTKVWTWQAPCKIEEGWREDAKARIYPRRWVI